MHIHALTTHDGSALSFLAALEPPGAKAGTNAEPQGAPAPAAPAAGTQQKPQQPPPGPMGILASPLFMLVIFVPFIWLMFRRNKKEQEARSKLKKGDRVVGGSGLVGELMDVDERFAKVKIAPGVTVQMVVSSVSPLDAGKQPEPTKDLKDAKASADKK